MYELHQAHNDIVCSLQPCPWPERRTSVEAGGARVLGDVRSLQVPSGAWGAPALVYFDIWCSELLMPFERRSMALPLHHQSTDIPEEVQVLPRRLLWFRRGRMLAVGSHPVVQVSTAGQSLFSAVEIFNSFLFRLLPVAKAFLSAGCSSA